ncbi:hypothetical protein AAMO2058_001457600 [Amorphochlora amoebiformis]
MRLSTAIKSSLFVVLLLATVTVSRAEDEEVEVFDVDELGEEEDDYEIGPSQDVETAFMFPDYPDNKLELGEIVKVLFLVNNKGSMGFNITHAFASLRSPYDYNYHIQNFSGMAIGVMVPPGRQASFEYLFKPDPNLEPTEFWLTAEILYNSTEARMYKNAVFNGTVELIEKSAQVDVRRFFKYLFGIAILGGGGYYVYTQNAPKKQKKKRAKAVAKTSEKVEVQEEEEEFELIGQAKTVDGKVKNRKVRRKSSKNKKGKK